MWKLYIPGLGKCGVDNSVRQAFSVILFLPLCWTWIVLCRLWLDRFEVDDLDHVTPESWLLRTPDL